MPRTGRPKKPDAEKRVHLHIRVTPETKAAVVETAEATGESRGEVVDRAVAALPIAKKES